MSQVSREHEQAVLYALRGRSGATFEELLVETRLSRPMLSQTLFRLTDRITFEGGVYMPRGVYARKARTTTEAPGDGAAPASKTRTRRGRPRRHRDPAGGGRPKSPVEIDYSAVLDDLRARRAQFDAVITSLEALVG